MNPNCESFPSGNSKSQPWKKDWPPTLKASTIEHESKVEETLARRYITWDLDSTSGLTEANSMTLVVSLKS